MNLDPRIALSQELEAKQTLLDQLRALAAEDPDFFADLIEGETNLLELTSSSAGSSSIPSSRSVSRPCARPRRRSPSQRRASRPSPKEVIDEVEPGCFREWLQALACSRLIHSALAL